jgi:hypothetical protein
MGYPLRVDEIELESLVPTDTRLEDLPKHDQAVASRVKEAAARGMVLR